MDDSSPVVSVSLRAGVAWQTPASVWQPDRPVLVYDPALSSSMQARPGSGFARFLCRTTVIWLSAATLGAAVAGILALTNPVSYAASGLLLGLGADEAMAQDELAIIRSDAVMRGVAERIGVTRLAPDCLREAPSAACAARAVKGQMQARIVGDPNGIQTSPMLRLTATHTDPMVAIAMLDAAVAIDRQIWYAAHPAGRADVLDPQLIAAQSALDGTTADIARVRAQAHVTNIKQDLAQAAADTAAITRQDNELRLRQVAAAAESAAAENALRMMPATVLDSREVSTGDSGQDSRALLLQLKLQRAHLIQLYARDYPGVAELDHKIETVEAAMKDQAKSSTSVTRDIRNPVLAVLATRMAALSAESAGLVQQRQELRRQWDVASNRETGLRDAEQRLSVLQRSQDTQDAVVRQLTLSAANLRSQESLSTANLAQRRLLQRPEAVVVPWTGALAAAVIGTLVGLLYGCVLSIIAWRRRPFSHVVDVSRRALERVWLAPPVNTPPQVTAVPQVMAVPLPPTFAAQTPDITSPPMIAPASEPLVQSVAMAPSMRMFEFRRERDIKFLGFTAQAATPQAATGG